MNFVSDFYRHRERLRVCIRELATDPTALTLDVGCKGGDVTVENAAQQRHVIAVDIDLHEEWRDSPTNIDYLQADAMALPFADETFDLASMTECLQYVPDPEQALDEIHRVLKPDAMLVVSFPDGNFLTNFMDPWNIVKTIKRLFRCAGDDDMIVRHIRVARVLEHCRATWDVEQCLRRGSMLFIYCAWWIDKTQALRLALLQRGAIGRFLGDTILKRLMRVKMWVMNVDFRFSIPVLRYNNIVRLRKRP